MRICALVCLIVSQVMLPTLFGQDFHSPLILSPYSVSTGDVFVGKTSSPQTVTLLNTGPDLVRVVSVEVTGNFKETNDCPAPPMGLAYNETCMVQITFTRDAVGPASGTLTVSDDIPGGPLRAVLTGTGTLGRATAEIAPAALNFGEQTQGTMSPPQTVTLSNTGKKALVVSNIAVSGDFIIMPNSTYESLSGPLTPGSKCTMAVTFSPLGAEKREGQITIMDDAADSPQKISLSGVGK